jgi:hypothetical protein
MQQSAGITTAQALARLGMDSSTWLVSRAALSVILVCLSGWTRYHPPAATSAADERATLERELELEPLRTQLRARKALGWRELAGQMIQGAPATSPESAPAAPQDDPQSEHAPHMPPRPPTGPGTPARASKRRRQGRARHPAVLRLTPPETPEQRIRAVLASEPTISIRQLAQRAAVSHSTASKYARVVRLEASRAAQ